MCAIWSQLLVAHELSHYPTKKFCNLSIMSMVRFAYLNSNEIERNQEKYNSHLSQRKISLRQWQWLALRTPQEALLPQAWHLGNIRVTVSSWELLKNPSGSFGCCGQGAGVCGKGGITAQAEQLLAVLLSGEGKQRRSSGKPWETEPWLSS